jgi:hypothetical protein
VLLTEASRRRLSERNGATCLTARAVKLLCRRGDHFEGIVATHVSGSDLITGPIRETVETPTHVSRNVVKRTDGCEHSYKFSVFADLIGPL